MPVLPFLTDAPENVEAVVRQAARAGARWVFPGYCFGVTLRQNQREYFYERLDEEFPGLRERYSRTFGDRYVCRSPQARALGTIFRRACREEGLVYRWKTSPPASGRAMKPNSSAYSEASSRIPAMRSSFCALVVVHRPGRIV